MEPAQRPALCFSWSGEAVTCALVPGAAQRLAIVLAAQETKTPPATYFIKKAMGMEESGGSQRPGHTEAGVISAKHLYEIALIKHQDTVRTELQATCRSLVGTCKSMGIRVVPRPEDA